jgi:hypothetical protein
MGAVSGACVMLLKYSDFSCFCGTNYVIPRLRVLAGRTAALRGTGGATAVGATTTRLERQAIEKTEYLSAREIWLGFRDCG